MKRSKGEREILQAVKEMLVERRGADEKQRKQIDAFMEMRRRAAGQFKQKLFNQALRAAGIDTQAIAERQARDQKAVGRFFDGQKKNALARSGKVNRRQKAKSAVLRERMARVVKSGSTASAPPVAFISTYLESAADIVTDRGTTSIAPGENLVHTQAHASGGGYLGGTFQADLVDIDWHFLWTPPADGFLNVTTFLQMNGFSWLAINSDCNGGSASSSVGATVTLTQRDAREVSHSDSQSVDLLDQQITDTDWIDSIGEVQFINLDESDTVGYRAFQFPAIGGLPIVMTVSATLFVDVYNGQAILDFMSEDFRLNVPFVFLSLNTTS